MATLQFVSSMTASPTVLLDLNSTSSGLQVSQGWDFSPAKFDKGWATSPLRHGARNTRAAAQNISLTIPLEIVADTDSAAATAIENLGRQLAVNNILMVQVGAPNPVFYRTFGNPDYAMVARNNLLRDTRIELQIDAEPFAYGPRVEVTGSPFTISNDPTNATNPCRIDISSVQGDVATPLLLISASTGVNGLASKWSHVSTRRRGTPGNYSNTIQAEAMTQGTNATITGDGTMSGGSKSRISFGTATNQLRLSATFPANGVSTVEARGEYRVYGRFAKTTAADTISVQLGYGTASSTAVMNDAVTLPAAASGPYWVDLGKIPVPLWSDPGQVGFSGVNSKVLLPFVGLWAARSSGSGSLDVDCLYFMPADDSTVIVKWPSTDTTYVLDGTTPEGGAAYAMRFSLDEIIATNTAPQIVGGGGFPELIPGQTNRIHFIRHVDPAGTVDNILSTTTFNAYYWPRWREYSRT